MESILILLGVLLLQSCFQMRTQDQETRIIFNKKNSDVNIKRYSLKSVDYPVRVVSGNYDVSKDVAIFFIHGAPGSSDNYYEYLQDSLLLEKANLYSIDRPGYGFSNFGKSETSIKKNQK